MLRAGIEALEGMTAKNWQAKRNEALRSLHGAAEWVEGRILHEKQVAFGSKWVADGPFWRAHVCPRECPHGAMPTHGTRPHANKHLVCVPLRVHTSSLALLAVYFAGKR
jgi:hypothetical protein